jgi:hypothetical protein
MTTCWALSREWRAAVLAAALIAGCTYDFDKFAASADAALTSEPPPPSKGAEVGGGMADATSGDGPALATGRGGDSSTGGTPGTGGQGGTSSLGGSSTDGTQASSGGTYQTGGTIQTGGGVSLGGAGGVAGRSAAPQGGAGGLGGQIAQGGAGGGTRCSSNAVSYAGICWYLGGAGSTCDQVCASRGQLAPEAAMHVGTASQGGSLTECSKILSLLGTVAVPSSGKQVSGNGFGCHLYGGSPWWIESPDFSSAAKAPEVRIVCGCVK